MSKKGFSAARLSIKIGMLVIFPLLFMTQIPTPSGQPVLSFNDLNPQGWVESKIMIVQRQLQVAYRSAKQWINREPVTGRASMVVYRFKGPQGNWQYSQTPPAGVNAEKLVIEDKSMRLPKPNEQLSQVLTEYEAKSHKQRQTAPINQPLSMKGVQKLIKESSDIQQKLEARQDHMEKF